jgi:hypothetical protein
MNTERTRQLMGRGTAGLVALAMGAVCLFAVLLSPAAADAKRGLETGFADEDYQSPDATERALWLGRTVDSGAGIVRLTVLWGPLVKTATKPADPTNPGSTSYDFSGVDPAVRDAEARGLKVLLSVNGPAPDWAEGPGRAADAPPGTWKPNPSDLADFLQALAARYNGSFDPDGAGPAGTLPSADAVQVWNEPNEAPWLTPQFEGKTAVAADFYRDMLNASYKSIKAVNPRMQVVTGGTAPYGDPPGGPYSSIGARIRPVQFWREVFCVQALKTKKKGKKGKPAKPRFAREPGCSAPTQFDVFAHHPISNTGAGPEEHGPTKDEASTPDLGRVVQVLRGAEKLGTVSGGKHPVWVTELWWDSKPPNSQGASLATQARWLEQSLFLFWKAGASVAINFQIRDSNLRQDARAGYQAGVYFINGQPKTALTAFRFPFVADRVNKGTLEVWGKSPLAGKLAIQRQMGGRWVNVRRLGVSQGGVFDTKLKLTGTQRLRAQVSGTRSLVWKQK